MHPKDYSPSLAERLQGLNLYLVGMMGSGKSTVGPALATALGYRFIDADAVISQAAGCPIPEIFSRDGEAGFRALERQVLQQISQWHSLVVATGGGVVTTTANWGELQQGVVIWLDVAEELLLARLGADPTPRPLLARLPQLLEERRPLYGQADLRVNAGAGGPETVVEQILGGLPPLLKARSAPQTTAP